MAINSTTTLVSASVGAVVVSILGAIGIEAEPLEYFIGLFMACFFGAITFMWDDERDGRSMILVLSTAAIIATFAAIIHPTVLSNWPIAAVMMLSGGLSRYMVKMMIKLSQGATRRSDTVLDRFIGKSRDKKGNSDG